MPPKMRFGNKGKGVATSSDAPRLPTFPWPRPEYTPFNLATDGLPPSSPTAWDEIDAYHYNRLLQLKLEPTRFLCEDTLEQLGLKDQVRSILYNARCMGFALEEDVLFPDITRQCLATATLTYANPESPLFDEASFSFFAGGKKYSIHMREDERRLEAPKFKESKSFWRLIASGEYTSNSASQNRLRHPALRIAARMLSNMLSARAEGNIVHIDELMLLFLGVGPIVGKGLPSDQFEHYRCNLGIRFAEALCAIKSAPTTTTRGPRTERIGSLLTPLFRHLKVDLSDAFCVEELSKLDMQHLIFSKIVNKGGLYRFISAAGEDNFISLPNPIVQLDTMEDLAFQPAPEHLAPNPFRSPSSPRPSTCSRGGTSQPSTCSPTRLGDIGSSVRRLTYHADTKGEFDLPPITDDADDAEYRRWMINSTKKNNSLLQRIMDALSKGCCHSTAARDTEPAPSTSNSSSGPPLVRKKRRTHGDTTSSR